MHACRSVGAFGKARSADSGRVMSKLVYAEVMPFDAWIGARWPHELHRGLSSMGYVLADELANDRIYMRADLVRMLTRGAFAVGSYRAPGSHFDAARY